MPINDKVRCTECDWTGRQHEVLVARNPFRDNGLLNGCPQCGVEKRYIWWWYLHTKRSANENRLRP